MPDTGATWLQRIVSVKEAPPGRAALVKPGDTHGNVEVYWNGKRIGSNDFYNPPPVFQVNSGDLKVGDNVLAVRFFEAERGAGITSGKTPFRVELPEGNVSLEGPWLARAEFTLPTIQERAPALRVPPHDAGNTASYLYNGMVAPLAPYALRGVLWYQGESNASNAAQYREEFPLLIADWRSRWGRGDFPFYWCQLANFQVRQKQLDEAGWAELREAQTSTLRVPDTGQAILIDVGEEANIHPRDKADVGARLAGIALAKDYGQKSVVWSGPILEQMTVEGAKVRLKFAHADGGLVAKPTPIAYQPASLQTETKPTVRHSPGGQLEGFVICGADHQWQWATAANIDGADSVVLTCAEVLNPEAVRYAWANNPLCNLANAVGLPAEPFRTDHLPLTTAGAKY